jgi:hypothetical protein
MLQYSKESEAMSVACFSYAVEFFLIMGFIIINLPDVIKRLREWLEQRRIEKWKKEYGGTMEENWREWKK